MDAEEKEEIKEISLTIKKYLAPKNILTSKHLQNLLQNVRHLMVLQNLLKKVAAFFPKLIIKLDGTNHEAQLKLKFLTSLRRIQVQMRKFPFNQYAFYDYGKHENHVLMSRRREKRLTVCIYFRKFALIAQIKVNF